MNNEDQTDQKPPVEPGQATGGAGFPRSVAALVAAVLILAAGSIIFSMNRDSDGSLALVDDDFSQAADHWDLDNQEGISPSIEEGAYRVSLSQNDRGWLDSVTFEDATEYPVVIVETAVVFDQVADGANVGLACISNPGDEENLTGLFGHYEARIDLDGHALVERFVNGDTVTIQEVESPVLLEETEKNDLSLECRYEDNTAFITLSLNDEEVISVENATPLAGYEGAGMVANTIAPGLEVSFEYLTAKSP